MSGRVKLSQNKQNKYRILMIYVEYRKMVQMNLFARQEKRCRRREWVCGHRGWCGMNWEIGIGMCAVPCAKQIASGKLLYSTGGSALCYLLT